MEPGLVQSRHGSVRRVSWVVLRPARCGFGRVVWAETLRALPACGTVTPPALYPALRAGPAPLRLKIFCSLLRMGFEVEWVYDRPR